MQLLNRSGLAAIAAATALVSTPVLAQEAAPVTTDPAPIVADEPLPTEPTTAPEAVAEPLAPAATTTSTRTTATPRPPRATAAPAARAQAPAARSTAPANIAPATPVAPLEQALPPVDPAMVALLPEPVAPAPVAPPSDSVIDEDALPIAGAAGLGILALIGAGFAIRRRRRRDEDVVVEQAWHEPAMSHKVPPARMPVAATAAPMAASAFGWAPTAADPAPAARPAPVNRIEAAKRGPTPDNPSLSLKKRLKRAAFFDQRDRQIAAGLAAPLPSSAGLPERMASAAPANRPDMPRQDRGLSMSFGKTFQPA